MSSRETLQSVDPSDLTRATMDNNEDVVGSLPFPMSLDKEAGVRTVMCSGCSTVECYLEEGKTMKRCSRCKGPWYCSKECQLKDWPKHKPDCHKVEGPGITQFIEAITSNLYTSTYLQLYAAFSFDMFEDYCDDNPPMIHVYLSIEPSDIHDFFAIVESAPDPSKKIEGMVQVTGAGKNTESDVLTGMRLDIWRKCVPTFPKGTKPFFIHFTCSRSELAWDCCIPLTERVLKYARSSPTYDYLTPEGEAEAPLDEDIAIQYLNNLIRADRGNRFKMRTDMTQFDIEVIRGLIDGENKSHAVKMLKRHVFSHALYAPIRSLVANPPA
ncbi:uncharacterized protein STEHIDRAFT_116588 [Stereum hirsutum FP-91666 SS1]|uniref:MYND-type domain-containing protein n=1 Tax=Stereum hirsutum (strain FP-91666) TaxID=721885 RepID=R7RVY6_STEHR|nr:uncharacterized protein STEHIDRAFT_116588 [Stereum hirsutum FP-91666 SS1]EIM79399.1 hypothetical protein STEHIDRAFT_116588 [Stereum hirsutum FP-91666 SS1]